VKLGESLGGTWTPGDLAKRFKEVDDRMARAEKACADAGLPDKAKAVSAARASVARIMDKAVADAKPQLPVDPPPPLGDATSVPSFEASLAGDPAYGTLWDGQHRDDLNALLTHVSQIFSTVSTKGGATASPRVLDLLQKRKLDSPANAIIQIALRAGTLPVAFTGKLGAHLDATSGEAHLGTWSATKPGKVEHDYSGLAAWVRRDRPEYVREFLLEKHGGPFRWHDYVVRNPDTGEVTTPLRPALARERAALAWLALLTPLLPAEAARAQELASSKLGDAPPEMVNLTNLLSEYRSNEVRADGEFKGHVVQVSGTAREIKKNALDHIYVVVGAGQPYGSPDLHCEVDDWLARKAASYSKGDDITVRGRVRGMILTAVILGDCEFAD
jgi:hypothetical protein